MPARWQYWLYPELGKFDPPDRERALRRATDTSFDWIEIVGMILAVAFTVFLTRYSAVGFGLTERIGAALANFVISIPLLLVLAGPFYVRRTRRSLREQIKERSEPKQQ